MTKIRVGWNIPPTTVLRRTARRSRRTYRTMKQPRKLEPLVPEDELKAFVRAVIAVPKEAVDKAEAARPKRKRTKKATRTAG